MPDAAFSVFESIAGYADLEELVANGEAEGLHLECKAPSDPKLTRDLKAHLAKAISGFSNTAGGVVIWGMSTTDHEHSGLDVLTQIEPIGQCKQFAQQVEKAIPALTTPAILHAQVKVIKEHSRDTRGIVLAYIPKHDGDPVQSTKDNLFWFRSGDEFCKAPYEMIKRLFASSESPDVYPWLIDGLVEQRDNETWRIPIAVRNASTAIGEHVYVSVTILNPAACQSVVAEARGLRDTSALNPGQKTFEAEVKRVVYRGAPIVLGALLVRMKVGKRPKRSLKLEVQVFANRMRARATTMTLQLARTGFSISKLDERFLY